MTRDAPRVRTTHGILLSIYAVALAGIGALLSVGGAYLVRLAGSPYYLLAGIATLASSVLLWRRDRRAAAVYGIMLVGTIGWAIWEAGFSGWALAARLIGPCLLGSGFVFVSWDAPVRRGRRKSGWLAFAGGAAAAVLVGTCLRVTGPPDDPDPLFRNGVGTFPARAAPLVDEPVGDWRNYGNDPGGTRFSPLDQITPANVGRLRVVWEVRVGGERTHSLEVTPIKVGDALFACTANNDILSIDAETGRLNWRFGSGISFKGRPNASCRGVAYFRVPGATGACAERIITNTIDARALAVDATNGRVCADFGRNGQIDLTVGMGPVDVGYYYVSSAPTIVRGRIVLGGWVSDNQHWGEPSGVIRAYDATTGRFAWAFDMGRPGRTGEPRGAETYTRSTPNSWAPMSADSVLGLVYVPTGNARPIIMVCSGARSTNATPARSSRWMSRPAGRGGYFRRRTTICGTTTLPHSPHWSICPGRAARAAR